jgi:hypothetical protein
MTVVTPSAQNDVPAAAMVMVDAASPVFMSTQR